MINVLPPEVKSQMAFAKRNSRLLHWVFLMLMVLGLLIALMWFSRWYANRQLAEVNQSLAERRQAELVYKDTEANVKTLKTNLGLVEKLLSEDSTYSLLLADLAASLPTGSYINHITLTGDDKQPLEILATVDSFKRGAVLKNALIASDRISSADIQSITKNQDSPGYSVVLIAAFEPGKAR